MPAHVLPGPAGMSHSAHCSPPPPPHKPPAATNCLHTPPCTLWPMSRTGHSGSYTHRPPPPPKKPGAQPAHLPPALSGVAAPACSWPPPQDPRDARRLQRAVRGRAGAGNRPETGRQLPRAGPCGWGQPRGRGRRWWGGRGGRVFGGGGGGGGGHRGCLDPVREGATGPARVCCGCRQAGRHTGLGGGWLGGPFGVVFGEEGDVVDELPQLQAPDLQAGSQKGRAQGYSARRRPHELRVGRLEQREGGDLLWPAALGLGEATAEAQQPAVGSSHQGPPLALRSARVL
jgi:hypothetical protein